MILNARLPSGSQPLRLDDAAVSLFPQLSKGEVRRIIDRGGCAVNRSMVRVASRTVGSNDEITLGIMEAGRFRDFVLEPALILHEDRELLAINKPSGVNSQRSPYQLKGTVEYAVGQHLLAVGISGPVMIVHRLDRGTSGAMFFPKSRPAAAYLSQLFKEGGVEKRYWALVTGAISQEQWRLESFIAKIAPSRYGVAEPGKLAITDFRLLAVGNGASLVEATPLTGRTHQIRVHLAHLGHPIVGDTTYGGESAQRLMLHCRSLAITTRQGGALRVEAPVDQLFAQECSRFAVDIHQQ